MLQIGICDDNKEARFTLSVLLERYLENQEIPYTLYEFSSGEGLLGWYEKNTGKLDLVFLDIEMSGISGMDTAHRLRAIAPNLIIAFVTSYPDYVFDGYSVDAVGYLLKPAKTKQVEDIITRTLATLHRQEKDIFTVQNTNGIYRIPKDTILYFFSEKRQVTCVTARGNYTFYARLNDVETEVGNRFVRIHQRYLVNAKHIVLIQSEAVYIGEIMLPISRSYREQAILSLTSELLK